MSDKVIVCRCEDVTLGDVRGAFEKSYNDLESVKRYTGFGTGMCQGKQCTVAVARVLVELGSPPPEAPITPRPPLHPIPLGQLAGLPEHVDGEGNDD